MNSNILEKFKAWAEKRAKYYRSEAGTMATQKHFRSLCDTHFEDRSDFYYELSRCGINPADAPDYWLNELEKFIDGDTKSCFTVAYTEGYGHHPKDPFLVQWGTYDLPAREDIPKRFKKHFESHFDELRRLHICEIEDDFTCVFRRQGNLFMCIKSGQYV